MSAWICPDAHINVIVSYFVGQGIYEGLWFELDGNYQYLTKENAGIVAQKLHAENVRSVNARYREETSDEYTGWQYHPQVRELYSEADIAQALNSYDYQSCETDDYHETWAAKTVNLMRKDLLRQITDNVETDTWCIDEVRTDKVVRA